MVEARRSASGDGTLNTLTPVDDDGGDGTTVTQQIDYPTREARDAALAAGMTQGLCAGYDRLDEYLQTMG